MRRPERPVHDGIGLAVIVAALGLLLAMSSPPADPCPGGMAPNHSGVTECHVGPYTGPLPIDTTNGGDITL